MIVISLTDCPPKVRGDLSKWLIEINTGVFVGHLSSRVRDELWLRICENLKNGRATMVYNAANEQKMDFRIHNTDWQPVDFDGLKLIRRPLPCQITTPLPEKFSNASKLNKIKNVSKSVDKKINNSCYVVIGIKTTGLSPLNDEIIEIGALKIEYGEIKSEFSSLINISHTLPNTVMELTGITNEEISLNGQNKREVLSKFIQFIGNEIIVCHHASFDISFLKSSIKKCNIDQQIKNKYIDTTVLARQKIDDIESYKLCDVQKHFCIPTTQSHRALDDCRIVYLLYEKLKVI